MKKVTKKKVVKKKETLKVKLYKMDSKFMNLETKLDMIRKSMARIELKLNSHINRKTAEIRVVEDFGKWGDYTGVFYADSKDEDEVVIDKAMKHYKTYFKDVDFYKKKTLGLFVNGPRGNNLVKILQNNGNELTDE